MCVCICVCTCANKNQLSLRLSSSFFLFSWNTLNSTVLLLLIFTAPLPTDQLLRIVQLVIVIDWSTQLRYGKRKQSTASDLEKKSVRQQSQITGFVIRASACLTVQCTEQQSQQINYCQLGLQNGGPVNESARRIWSQSGRKSKLNYRIKNWFLCVSSKGELAIRWQDGSK